MKVIASEFHDCRILGRKAQQKIMITVYVPPTQIRGRCLQNDIKRVWYQHGLWKQCSVTDHVKKLMECWLGARRDGREHLPVKGRKDIPCQSLKLFAKAVIDGLKKTAIKIHISYVFYQLYFASITFLESTTFFIFFGPSLLIIIICSIICKLVSSKNHWPQNRQDIIWHQKG